VTDRQKAILEAVIREFMKDADAIGSMNLVARYGLDASPATVRHEMVELADQGYLVKSHCSSGRVPTDLGIKFFINELMVEDQLDNNQEVKVRITLSKNRFDEEKMIARVLEFLASETGYAAVTLLGNELRYRGISSLMDYEELRDINILEVLLKMLENNVLIKRIMSRESTGDVYVVIGRESNVEGLENCAMVVSSFRAFGGKRGRLGVLGPRRMQYSRVIPAVKAVTSVIDRSTQGW
jgi:transcriptional regulator of heat shock response